MSSSSVYYVFVVFDETYKTYGNACVASLSPTAPIMPSLYGSTFSDKRLIGVLFTDGASELIPFDVSGTGHIRHYQWWTPVTVLSAGVAVADTPISLASAVPSAN